MKKVEEAASVVTDLLVASRWPYFDADAREKLARLLIMSTITYDSVAMIGGSTTFIQKQREEFRQTCAIDDPLDSPSWHVYWSTKSGTLVPPVRVSAG